jgi:hypothetical protein
LQWIVCPLMHALSAEAKNTTHVAILLGRAGPPIGLTNCFCASSLNVDGTSGVHTGPGAMALTRTPLAPSCWLLRPRVKDTMPPLVDA